MYYTIYKTTNQLNGKTYIGYHSTKDLNDSYLGSGKILKQAIEKHGIDNFTKEILYIFPTKEEALQKESEIVDEAFVMDSNTYNMKLGGEGGFDHTYSDPEISERRQEGVRKAFEEGRAKGWQLTDEQRSRIGRSAFKGKTHTKETRKRISEAQKMDPELIERRIEEFNAIEKKWGYIGKLANQWNISHTQVRRFMKQYELE